MINISKAREKIAKLILKIDRSYFLKTLTRHNLDKNIIPIIKKYSKGNVLDIGALHSPYKKYLNYEKYSILDISNNPNVTYKEDIHKTSLKSNTFDTIIVTEVLEHLYNPFKAVDEMRRILKKNGYLIGSTRFIFPYHGEPHDYFRFTEFGLKKIFSQFRSVKIIPLGNRLMAIIDLITTTNIFLKLCRPLTLILGKKSSRKSKAPLGFIIIVKK